MAEREGFEPPIGLHLCRISSAVHSTTLPPLQAIEDIHQSVALVEGEDSDCYRFATQYLRRASLRRFETPRQRGQQHLPAFPEARENTSQA